MTILGGVPISVTMLPKVGAKDNGINVRAGERAAARAACRSTGISNARAATLFIIAESTAARPLITPTCSQSARAPSTSRLATSSTTPALDRPREMINTKAMTTVAG